MLLFDSSMLILFSIFAIAFIVYWIFFHVLPKRYFSTPFFNLPSLTKGSTQPKINRKPSSDEEDDHHQEAAFFICEICTEQLPLQQRLHNKQQTPKNSKKKNKSPISATAPPPCAHPFCTNCIARYIQAKIGENENPEIRCPDTNCVYVLDPLSCRSFLPQKVFVRWCDYLCQSTVSERYDTAYCPNPSCSELVLNECKERFWRRWLTRKKHKISKCPRCEMMFCLRCMVVCQDHYQCSNKNTTGRISRRVFEIANEVLFMTLVATKSWKRCPRCKFYVERRNGCAHITCRCGYHFCYGCGAEWSYGYKCCRARL